ncbi:MAG: hypothetical protein ABTR27_00195, partial [Candidatus Competibacter phosphatis]
AGATVIDGGGRTLMPGLIDAHWHTLLSSVTLQEASSEQADYLHARAIVGAEKTPCGALPLSVMSAGRFLVSRKPLMKD